ncbi:hypothetical protein FRX31_019651 [Thalictrum thalictroides]|uniref:Uncharacterized protein n=1 Tax=Thalictrum thalictroides TaxID=46969 RepID=A0A7J6W100_THATH|nr:hypothetical protein FRX31_019651 [Thalictrum thalictroides]
MELLQQFSSIRSPYSSYGFPSKSHGDGQHEFDCTRDIYQWGLLIGKPLSHERTTLQIRWSPPFDSWLELNTDGSSLSLSDFRPTESDVVIRNSYAEVI